MPFDLVTGRFIPTKSNIWRDACDGFLDFVKEHVEAGCTLDEADPCGDPPLVLAAGGGHTTVAAYLLDEGANIEQRSVMGETTLIRAAHNGHLASVELLLQRGADIHARDIGDNRALHWAAMRGHVEVVRLLLAAGASKEAQNAQGATPAELCQPVWSLSWRFTQQVLESVP